MSMRWGFSLTPSLWLLYIVSSALAAALRLPVLEDRLKLDLHSHVFEEFLPGSPKRITVRSVEKIVQKVRDAGLDGIAITEHDTKAYGYRVKEIVAAHFDDEILIIPGCEFESVPIHFVELDLPLAGNRILPFRFLAHPGYPGDPSGHLDGFSGIEIGNGLHNWHIDQAWVRNTAAKCNLVMLSNSDAHYLRDLGRCYSEVSLEDLIQAARSVVPSP
jgi:PHP-associated